MARIRGDVPAEVAVEVAYARPDTQELVTVRVTDGATVRKVIEKSGILERFPEIDLEANKVGIFSRTVSLDHPVSANDRIEIYRPLLVDPREARRLQAASKKKRKN